MNGQIAVGLKWEESMQVVWENPFPEKRTKKIRGRNFFMEVELLCKLVP